MTSIRFLGTGTIGARPKNKLAKEYRRFSSLLIDERLLIDPSEDIFEFESTYQLAGLVSGARNILITHTHLDHLSITALEALGAIAPIHVFGTKYVGEWLFDSPGVIFHEILPYGRFSAGDYDIIPLPTNHITDNASEAVIGYLILGEKNIFYAPDGAYINPGAFEVLKAIKLDLCILDCTLGASGYSELLSVHNNLDMAKNVREVFLAAKCATESTKFVLTHIKSAKGRNVTEELIEKIADYPMKVAYDGYYIGI